MAFYKSNLGHFGEQLPCDLNGRVPETGDEPTDFTWDHDEFTTDFDEAGNGYEGFADEQWSTFVAETAELTRRAEEALDEWRE